MGIYCQFRMRCANIRNNENHNNSGSDAFKAYYNGDGIAI